MVDDATHAPRVPTKLRTKRGATKRMSELCALDDSGQPNASTMDADDAPTSMSAKKRVAIPGVARSQEKAMPPGGHGKGL